jgi:hypothetical protein
MSNSTMDTDADDVPRRVNGMHRSDLARIKDVVLIARQQVAEGVALTNEQMRDMNTTLDAVIVEVKMDIETLSQAFTNASASFLELHHQLEALRQRMPQARWKRFVAWCRALLPHRITAKRYANAVEGQWGHGPQAVRTRELKYRDDIIGHYVKDADGARFNPDRDAMMRHCATQGDMADWISTLDATAAQVMTDE